MPSPARAAPLTSAPATVFVLLPPLALAAGWDALGLDLPVATLAGSVHGFAWRDDPLLAQVLHNGGRWLAWLLCAALALAAWWPRGALASLPLSRRVALAATPLACVALVALAKFFSKTSCPWDLQVFGGVARLRSHWSAMVDGGPGHCFPAGHAASGFAFAGGFFAWREHHPVLARRWLAAAAGSGLLLGLAQQWRGAHFMSHTLWTACLCWTVAWVIDQVAARVPARGGP